MTAGPAAVYRQTAGELLADLERTAAYATVAPAREQAGLAASMAALESLAAQLILAAERLEQPGLTALRAQARRAAGTPAAGGA